MAMTIGNVQNVKFLRNNVLYATYEDAYAALSQYASTIGSENIIDGTSVLARYGSGNNVKTLVGYLYNNGTYSSITIFDIEGSEADVQALREEINAKLGNGITSGNTVTMQLGTLSGTSQDTSAATSVAGAKAYAKDYTDEQISGLDYSGITTSNAAVVTNVTEADGKVNATSANVGNLKLTDYVKGSDSGSVAASDSVNQAVAKLENQIDAEKDAREAAIAALDYTDTAATKSFVIKVDEADGVIATTKGSITSNGETIVLTDNVDGGVNFEVHYDGTTIIQDPTTKELKVASSALVQYKGDEDTIHISDVVGDTKTVSSLLTIQKVTTGLSEEVKEEYHLVGASGNTIGAPVKIYKDSHIVSIDYDSDTQELVYTYLDVSGATQTIRIDMSELVLEAEFASGVTVTDHVAHGVVDPTSETFLTVGASGFKLSGVQDAINSAVNGLDADVSGNSTHVTVGVEEVDGKISAVTVSESNIANADDLATLSGKTITAITSTNGSITATPDDAVGNKSVNIETDASKIKMTGFTADASGFTAITTASTVTDAVKAAEAAHISNKSEIDGLDGRLDKVEDEYISGITVNGSGLTVTDNVAAIEISAATSATTSSNGSAITVETDANGNITLGLSTIDCGTY